MKCDRPDETELAPYVICAVGDLAWKRCTASSEQPVNQDVWTRGSDRGIAAQKKDPRHIFQTEVIKSGTLISVCGTFRLKTNMFRTWRTFSSGAVVRPPQTDSERKRAKMLLLINFKCVGCDLLWRLEDLQDVWQPAEPSVKPSRAPRFPATTLLF